MELRVPEGAELLMVPMSREEYDALPEMHHAEWWDGCLVVSSPVYDHSRAAFRLAVAIHAALPAGLDAGVEAGWVLPDAEFVPDLVVARARPDRERLSDVDVPLLAVEVLSRSTRHIDLGVKRTRYAEAGLAWYWVVDLDRRELIVMRNDGGSFVEVERLTTGTTSGPFPVSVDIAAL